MPVESYKLDSKLRCPYCDKKLDGAIACSGDLSAPRKGDYSICLYCHGFLEYGLSHWDKLKIRDVKNPKVKDELLSARKLIRIYGQMNPAAN